MQSWHKGHKAFMCLWCLACSSAGMGHVEGIQYGGVSEQSQQPARTAILTLERETYMRVLCTASDKLNIVTH